MTPNEGVFHLDPPLWLRVGGAEGMPARSRPTIKPNRGPNARNSPHPPPAPLKGVRQRQKSNPRATLRYREP